MAKQTFTTGAVLTSAQMTSLQQTAMGGGSATAKTASYTLVAADAGTTVAMSAAGATTITVNTALFAAGDTVFIQNLGAGACTVTAGTATVATAGSLILPQNDAGILYFTATGASIFYDYIQAGAVSPLTTKGDVYTFSTSDARLAVGTNGQVLTADSSEATGLKFATPSSGGKLIQAVFASTSTGASSSSSTYADTNLTATITPTSASNSIYVFVSQCGIIKSSANSLNGLNLKLFRGATEIIFFGRNILFTNTAIQLNGSTASIVYKDSPATTSATTYKTQFASENNTATVYVNDSSATSTIVLMEVAP